jgi:hypothetical protein
MRAPPLWQRHCVVKLSIAGCEQLVAQGVGGSLSNAGHTIFHIYVPLRERRRRPLLTVELLCLRTHHHSAAWIACLISSSDALPLPLG